MLGRASLPCIVCTDQSGDNGDGGAAVPFGLFSALTTTCLHHAKCQRRRSRFSRILNIKRVPKCSSHIYIRNKSHEPLLATFSLQQRREHTTEAATSLPRKLMTHDVAIKPPCGLLGRGGTDIVAVGEILS